MNLHSWGFYWSEAWQNLSNNAALTIASVTSAAVSLLVLALFFTLSLNVGRLTQVMVSQVGIEVFLSQSITQQQTSALETTVEGWPDVKSVTYISKASALKTLEQDFGSSGQAFEPLGQNNPLLAALFIKAKTTSAVPVIAKRVQALGNVSKVNYQKPIVTRLFHLINIVRIAGLLAGILLALGALLVIHNAIRIGIFARRREIDIMRLTGATEGFIRWPFLLEGMILGIIGAVVAAAVAVLLYHLYVTTIQADLPFLPTVSEPSVDQRVIPLISAFGLLIGLLGSQFSIRRVRV